MNASSCIGMGPTVPKIIDSVTIHMEYRIWNLYYAEKVPGSQLDDNFEAEGDLSSLLFSYSILNITATVATESWEHFSQTPTFSIKHACLNPLDLLSNSLY
jgi:hypothetical protein